MSDKKEQLEEEILESELWDLEDEIAWMDEDEQTQTIQNDEISKLKDLLARTQADYNNFKQRSERDRQEMIFFLKQDIFKKILPRIDDLERIIKSTPEENKSQALFEWVSVLHKTLLRDLENLWVKPFDSIWTDVDPNKHEVMTQIPNPELAWKVIDEFEKWYVLQDKVLRVAKVIVWA